MSDYEEYNDAEEEYEAHWCPYWEDLQVESAEECEYCDNGVPK